MSAGPRVFITGGASGLGRALAEGYAADGARVIDGGNRVLMPGLIDALAQGTDPRAAGEAEGADEAVVPEERGAGDLRQAAGGAAAAAARVPMVPP